MDANIAELDFPNIKSVYDQISNEKDHTLPSLSKDLKKDILYLTSYDKKFYSFTNNLDKNIIDHKKFVYNFEHNVYSDSRYVKDYFEQNSYQTQLHLGYLLYTLDDYKSLQSLLLLGFEKNNRIDENEDSNYFGLLKLARDKIPADYSYEQPFGFKNSMDHLRYQHLECHMDEKAFFQSIEENDPQKALPFHVKDTLKHIYDMGMYGLPLLLGYDKKLQIEDFQHQLLKIKDITMDAEWESSSHRQGFDIESLLNKDINSSWQSNGFLPHIIDVKFGKITRLNNIMMFFSNSQNSSYAPFHIKIYGGTNELDLVLLKDFGIKRVEGFINFFFFSSNIKNKVITEDNQKFKNIHGLLKNGYVYNPPIEVKYLKIFIFSNKHRGKDSKLESIRLYQDLETNEAIDAQNGKQQASPQGNQPKRDWYDIMSKIKNKSPDASIDQNRERTSKSEDLMLGSAFLI